MKRIISVMLLFVMLISISACGKSSSSSLVGSWERDGNIGPFSKLEFFSDGTYTSDTGNYQGGYSVEGDSIRLEGRNFSRDDTYTFEIKGDKLTLYLDDGRSAGEYYRAGSKKISKESNISDLQTTAQSKATEKPKPGSSFIKIQDDGPYRTIAANGLTAIAILADNSTLSTAVKDYAQGSEKYYMKWDDIIDVDCCMLGSDTMVLGLKKDGTVIQNIPMDDENIRDSYDISSWSDIKSISMGNDILAAALGVKTDGTVVAVPSEIQKYVSKWKDIFRVAYSWNCVVGLKNDGTVVTVGSDEALTYFGAAECDNWQDIIAIDMGDNHIVGLTKDGTVVATGNNDYGQCDVGDWTDITKIAAAINNTVGVKKDGTVVAVGENDLGQCNVREWDNIVEIETDGYNTYGVKKDNTVYSLVVVAGEKVTNAALYASHWAGIKAE